MPKQGFKNQWVAISRKGEHRDSKAALCDLSDDFFKTVIANFTPNEVPLVVGHPKDNHPAFGWVSALRLENGDLEAQFADTCDEFEQMCADGKLRKRSASFYLDGRLRHVGFLGAMPPAIKGLRDIQFNDGDSVTVEISFSEDNQIMKDEEVEKVAESFFDKMKNLFKAEAVPSIAAPDVPAPTASFSEADAQKLIEAAVAKAKAEAKAETVAEFAEQIKGLTETVNANSASGKRAEIVSFVEAIPAQKGKHFLKRAGIVEFMEACATVDAANEQKEAISFSEGEGDKKVEHKFTMLGWAKNLVDALPPMIEFGEKFGNIKATADADAMVDSKDLESLRAGMGTTAADGGTK